MQHVPPSVPRGRYLGVVRCALLVVSELALTYVLVRTYDKAESADAIDA